MHMLCAYIIMCIIVIKAARIMDCGSVAAMLIICWLWNDEYLVSESRCI